MVTFAVATGERKHERQQLHAVSHHRRRGLHRLASRRSLLARGHRVHILDDLSTGSIDNIRHLKTDPRFSYMIDTCASASVVAELVGDADVVYHLAVAVGVELIVESPVRTIETNVHCTEVVLAQAAKKR